MSDADSRHKVLLDALESAGFPRSALSGAGNAIVWRDGDVVIAPREDRMVFRIKAGGETIQMDTNKVGAAQLGAFLLAWGHSP
ncbi:MAG: hypothetical protein WAV09_03090 [Minisyncoccia bacterium]